MITANLFESIMLICFGAAWPVSIWKSYTSGVNHGKSIFFLYLIFLGYICGVIYQYMVSHAFTYVFIFFFINLFLVFVDICIYYRNARMHQK